jgi:hypothetical protein
LEEWARVRVVTRRERRVVGWRWRWLMGGIVGRGRWTFCMMGSRFELFGILVTSQIITLPGTLKRVS